MADVVAGVLMPVELPLTPPVPRAVADVPVDELLVVEDIFMLLKPWLWCPMAPRPQPKLLVRPEVDAAAFAAQLL